ncbi:class I SAM-dependent methyltransferase [bacterium]|nr:class I SAM-dependent methyltransferase [bacterium]
MFGLRAFALAFSILALGAPLRAEEAIEEMANKDVKLGDKVAPRDEKAVWNKKYDRKMFLFGKKPNVFFASQLDKLTPGKLLLPAEGEGRNAVYAAKQKWKVDAFDVSDVAKDKALKFAEEEKVAINYFVSDASIVDLKPNDYDAVAVIFFQPQDNEATSKFFTKLKNSVKPGGSIIVEGFAKSHLKLKTRFGPKDLSCMYDKKFLKGNFKDWKISLIRERKTVLDEGMHDGKAIVIDFVAEKPNEK